MFCWHVCLCENIRSSGTGVTDSLGLACGYWELNLGPPEEPFSSPAKSMILINLIIEVNIISKKKNTHHSPCFIIVYVCVYVHVVESFRYIHFFLIPGFQVAI